MTTLTGKEKRPRGASTIVDGVRPPGFKPNRNTIVVRPRKAIEMTKAEMQADLKRAVENTK